MTVLTKKEAKKLAEIINRNFSRHGNYIDFLGFFHDLTEWLAKDNPNFNMEEFIAYCEKKQICPYEINKLLIRESTIVVCPYIYVFDLMIRNMLFDSLSVSEEDMILIIDEAHNLPDYIRELLSVELSMFMLNSCIFEAEKYGVAHATEHMVYKGTRSRNEKEINQELSNIL
jgi:DNA excision repair protein ERCC-2